jgi:hypothetical protein
VSVDNFHSHVQDNAQHITAMQLQHSHHRHSKLGAYNIYCGIPWPFDQNSALMCNMCLYLGHNYYYMISSVCGCVQVASIAMLLDSTYYPSDGETYLENQTLDDICVLTYVACFLYKKLHYRELVSNFFISL